MTNFSLQPYYVQGDLFTENGKWKYTVQIDMKDCYYDLDLHKAVVLAVRETPPSMRGVVDSAVGPESRFWLVVLEPYHRNSHPQMIKLSCYDEHLNYTYTLEH